MSMLAIESVQAHLEDLQREAAQRRKSSRAAHHVDVDKEGAPVARHRALSHVRRVLGAHS